MTPHIAESARLCRQNKPSRRVFPAQTRRLGRRDERGSGLVEVTWIGLILIVPLLWIVLSVFDVQRGAFGISAAARAAGRAYALAADDAQGRDRARRAARQALADQGLGDAPLTLAWSCRPHPGACHSGDSVVTVTVKSSVGLPLVPSFLGHVPSSVALDATQTVPIGQFREVADGV